jgi:hypothetical protein
MQSGTTGIRLTPILIVSATVNLLLAGCGAVTLLPRETETASSLFQSYDQVRAAYTNIVPGSTALIDLPKLGFDRATMPNVEILSSGDAIARVMPDDTQAFDNLPKPVQACIEAHERCSALLFHFKLTQSHREGNILLDAAGLRRETLSTGWSSEVVLLMQDDHVVYKLMSGRPLITNTDDSMQPLGALQDLGDTTALGLRQGHPSSE